MQHDDDSAADGERPEPGDAGPAPPPARVRLIGRGISLVASRLPWIWPLLRGRTTDYFDRLASGWDERVEARGAAHLAPLAVAVTKIDRRPERALDIGTGTGAAALFVAREFPHATVRGVDISEEMIKVAKSKIGLDPSGRVAFRVADSSALPYADASFDLITQLNMPPFFAEVSRLLRHGGHAIVAASSGDRTPFFTPDDALERGFQRHGMTRVTAGQIGPGSYFVARKGD